MKKLVFLLTTLIFFTSASLLANKTSVEIKAPTEIKKGTEVTLVISVFHNGNSKMHHTDWVVLNINGKEVKKWQYDKDNLPPDGNFVLEFKTVVTENITLEAEGHCNIHGTAGPKQATIKVI
jgi:desulfoferrodoxin (superoxide reductase-like protein)